MSLKLINSQLRQSETPTPLINGLKRLIKENLSNINPLPLYANWYYSHPGPEERILALMKYKTE